MAEPAIGWPGIIIFVSFTGLFADQVLLACMFRYGKLARQAVSAMSYLAENYSPGGGFLSSSEVSKHRKIPIALSAKLLSQLSGVGLTIGITGPGGGYRLARPPAEIHLSEIVNLFEREMDEFPCPFGKGWCGNGDPCPLHDDFIRIEENGRLFLEQTSLAVFMKCGEELPVTNRVEAHGGGESREEHQ
jgi:Rrf2 family iron-sulfur cluster assembly transcriptional regulator